jgi:hypothetical protein
VQAQLGAPRVSAALGADRAREVPALGLEARGEAREVKRARLTAAPAARADRKAALQSVGAAAADAGPRHQQRAQRLGDLILEPGERARIAALVLLLQRGRALPVVVAGRLGGAQEALDALIALARGEWIARLAADQHRVERPHAERERRAIPVTHYHAGSAEHRHVSGQRMAAAFVAQAHQQIDLPAAAATAGAAAGFALVRQVERDPAQREVAGLRQIIARLGAPPIALEERRDQLVLVGDDHLLAALVGHADAQAPRLHAHRRPEVARRGLANALAERLDAIVRVAGWIAEADDQDAGAAARRPVELQRSGQQRGLRAPHRLSALPAALRFADPSEPARAGVPAGRSAPAVDRVRRQLGAPDQARRDAAVGVLEQHGVEQHGG